MKKIYNLLAGAKQQGHCKVKILWYVVLIRLSLCKLPGGLASPSWQAKGAAASTCTGLCSPSRQKQKESPIASLDAPRLYALCRTFRISLSCRLLIVLNEQLDKTVFL